METRADTVKAVVYALLVHVLVLLMAFSGLFWWQSGKPLRAAGEPIEAVFVDLAALAPPAPPRPAPRPAPPPPPPQQPEPPTDLQADDTVDQQRIDQQALLRAEEEAREQEERRRRAEQVLLEEQERQRAEEQQRREREQQQQREREQRKQQQREAAERAAAEAAAREAAEREAAAAAAAAQAGQRGEDDGLEARYLASIIRSVHQRWRLPDNTAPLICDVRIVQVRGGTILSATAVRPCDADELARGLLERAVLAAEPLPYEGFESVFNREVILTFCHPQNQNDPRCTQ
ncbi:MAG: cell envelope integrity protein TolA [Xanthomonadales bacterium]|nr:cell envelope integrity protein TolA [Xanthomonadales bacterium]